MYDKRAETALGAVVIEQWKAEYEPLKRNLENRAELLTVEEYEKGWTGEGKKGILVIAATERGVQWAQKKNAPFIGDASGENPRKLPEAKLVVEGFEEVDYDFLERRYRRFYGYPWYVLETKRCVLREQTVDDLPELYRIYSGEGITDYMEPLYEDPEEEAGYLRKYIELVYGFYEVGLWLVIDKRTGEAIGRAGFTPESFGGEEQLELGYVFAKEFHHQGYATEVCRAILEYRETYYPHLKLNCLIERGNVPSVKLAERLGFRYVETLERGGKNLDRYCI